MMKYIGIPYLDKGRDFTGCDCYGLLMLYYKNELGIDIPDVNISAKEPRRSLAKYLEEIQKHWRELPYPEPNAGVAMCLNPEHPMMVTHFGVMIDEKRMLHTYENTNSHIVEINHPTVRNQIKGFYRWQH